jgi:hypothetical protein
MPIGECYIGGFDNRGDKGHIVNILIGFCLMGHIEIILFYFCILFTKIELGGVYQKEVGIHIFDNLFYESYRIIFLGGGMVF